jgi:hypothetical protein
MFGKRKKPPDTKIPFSHAPDCPIVRADPGYQPQWEEAEEDGGWRRICQCGSETVYVTDAGKTIDPYDVHIPPCPSM